MYCASTRRVRELALICAPLLLCMQDTATPHRAAGAASAADGTGTGNGTGSGSGSGKKNKYHMYAYAKAPQSPLEFVIASLRGMSSSRALALRCSLVAVVLLWLHRVHATVGAQSPADAAATAAKMLLPVDVAAQRTLNNVVVAGFELAWLVIPRSLAYDW
jgi:hypothetical protein